jgi:hypothetical protein
MGGPALQSCGVWIVIFDGQNGAFVAVVEGVVSAHRAFITPHNAPLGDAQ